MESQRAFIGSEGFPFASLIVEIPQHFLAIPFVIQMAFLNWDADHVRPERRDTLTTIVADAGIGGMWTCRCSGPATPQVIAPQLVASLSRAAHR